VKTNKNLEQMGDSVEIKHRIVKEGMGKPTGELGSLVNKNIVFHFESILLTCQTTTFFRANEGLAMNQWFPRVFLWQICPGRCGSSSHKNNLNGQPINMGFV
jgi:hypothetical protein